MVVLRLIKVLGGRIARLKDGKDRTGRTNRERSDAFHFFSAPHGWKSRKQVNVRQSSDRREYVEVTDSGKMSLWKR